MNVLYIHVPKTAGRSLLSLLSPLYAPEEMLYGDWPVITPLASPRYKFVAGHLYVRSLSLLDFHAHYRITILRDPVEQAISHYYHVNERLAHGGTVDAQVQHALDVGLQEAVMDGSIAWTFDTAVNHLSSFSAANASKEENVGSAKTNLLQFQAVGFVEDYDPFIRALCLRLKINIMDVPHENPPKWKPPVIQLTNEARTKLRQMLEHDYWLYNFARRKWGQFLVL